MGTGGYSITIESVVETDKNIIINVKESVPAPNSMVSRYYLSVLLSKLILKKIIIK
jgi:hypothetical protein